MVKIGKFIQSVVIVMVAFLFGYPILAFVVFQVRHPWATEMECLWHLPEALTFRSVPYREMRPRE